MRLEVETNLYNPSALAEKFSGIDTQFNVTLGKISAIISDSEIEQYQDGGMTLNSRLSSVIMDIDGLHGQFSSLSTEYDSLSGEYVSLNSKVTEIDASVDGLSASISSVQATADENQTNITNLRATVNGVSSNVTSLSTTLSNDYATKTYAENQSSTAQANAERTASDDATQKANQALSDAKADTIDRLRNYSTTSEMTSAINQKAEEISLSVSKSYATQTSVNEAKKITITDDTIHYLVTNVNTGVTKNNSGWSTSIQTVTAEKRYLWTYHTYTYGSGDTKDTEPVVTGVWGDQGEKGDDGKSAELYTITSTADAIVKDENGTLQPRFINFTSYKTISGESSVYSAYWIIEEMINGSWSEQYKGGATSLRQIYPSSNTTSVRARIYPNSNYLSRELLSSRTVPVVSDGNSGEDGEDAYTVILSNESHTFSAGTESAIAGSTECNVIAYKGATQVIATIGTISGTPTGMSTSISNNGTASAKFTVSVTSSMNTKNGTLTIPVTVDGKVFNKIFTYSLAIKGDTGVGISSVIEYYALNNSTTAPADSNFDTTVKTPTSLNKYLWNYEVVNYTDGSSKKQDKHIVAMYGEVGADGKGIKSITDYYAINNSTTAPDDSSFGTAVQSPTSTNKYLWNYEVITYTDNTSSSTSKHIVGTYGEQGVGLKSVERLYYASASNTTPQAPTSAITSSTTSQSTWTKSIPTLTGTYQYLFVCDQILYDDTSVGKNGYVWTEVTRDNATVDLSLRLAKAELKVTDDALISTVTKSDEFGNRVGSIIEQNIDSIRLKADKISWSSTYSSMTEDGVLTCVDALLSGKLENETTIKYAMYPSGYRSVSMVLRTTSISHNFYKDNTRCGVITQNLLVKEDGTIKSTPTWSDTESSRFPLYVLGGNRLSFGLLYRSDNSDYTNTDLGNYETIVIEYVDGTKRTTVKQGDLYYGSSKVAVVSTSSKRYKHDIVKLSNSLDSHKLLQLEPKQFVYNENVPLQYDDMEGRTIPGFIAEDVAEVYPSAVIHNEKGQIESWDERRIIPGMLALIQELYKRIEKLENVAN